MAQDSVLNALFQPIPAGNLKVTIPGQADALAASLANLISGAAPYTIPKTGIVAHAGGGKANATPLTAVWNSVDTVGTAADSVLLPLAQAGLAVIVANTTANSMQVFGAGTDTINGVATATGVAQAGGTHAEYLCMSSAPAGKWIRIQTA